MQTYARAAGVLLLVSLIAGGYGEFYVPSALIADDPTTTALNLHASIGTFRWGFAAYLIEAMCDVALTWIFYVLLRPIDRNLAFLAVLFRLMGTATFAVAEFFYFGGMLLAGDGYLGAFTPSERNSILQFVMQWFGSGGEVYTLFYGTGLAIVGYLFYRSAYIPKWVSALLVIGGAGFVLHNFTLVLLPTIPLPWLLLPAVAALLALALWLLIRGAGVPTGVSAEKP
jgi:hypothetical protein